MTQRYCPNLENSDDFDETIRLHPERAAQLYTARGSMYRKKGEHDKAIADLTEAIRRDPEYYSAYCERVLAYRAKGEHDKAEADFIKAVELIPPGGWLR